MLTLKDFIKDTLGQLTEAIVEFDEAYQETGASANPVLDTDMYKGDVMAGQHKDEKDRRDTIIPIDFDIAVTAGDAETKGGAAGIRVLQAVISAEGKLERQTENTSVSRVHFKVPLRLPDTGDIGTDPNRRKRHREAFVNAKAKRESGGWMA